jgi:hypothetical protein
MHMIPKRQSRWTTKGNIPDQVRFVSRGVSLGACRSTDVDLYSYFNAVRITRFQITIPV